MMLYIGTIFHSQISSAVLVLWKGYDSLQTKKTDGEMDEQTDKSENIYLFSLQEVGDLKQTSIYELVFEETGLLEYPWLLGITRVWEHRGNWSFH